MTQKAGKVPSPAPILRFYRPKNTLLAVSAHQKAAAWRFLGLLHELAATASSPFALWQAQKPSLVGSPVQALAGPPNAQPRPSWGPSRAKQLAAADPLDQLPIAPDASWQLVVHWRLLLGKAGFNWTNIKSDQPDWRTLSFHAWWCLLPLLERVDPVLHKLLSAAEQRYQVDAERRLLNPTWVGLDDPADQRLFDAQAAALLRSRWTAEQHIYGFCELAADHLTRLLGDNVAAAATERIGFCDRRDHRAGVKCPDCTDVVWERPFLVVLSPIAELPGSVVPLPSTHPVPPSSPTLTLLHFLEEVRHPVGGVIAEAANSIRPEVITFDIGLVQRTIQRIGGTSVLDDIADMTSFIPRALTVLQSIFGGPPIQRPATVVADVALECRDAVAHLGVTGWQDVAQIVSYPRALLRQRIKHYSRGVATLKRLPRGAPVDRRSALKGHPRAVRTIELSLDDGTPVKCLRANGRGGVRRNYYAVPLTVAAPDQRACLGYTQRAGETMFFSAHALARLTALVEGNGARRYPEAGAYLTWAQLQDVAVPDDTAFEARRADEQRLARAAAVLTGARASMGHYTPQEDLILRDFFLATGKRRTRISREETAALLAALPGRTLQGVYYRFEQLGFEYALEHGWAAYVASPYHRKFSAQRRAQWCAQGVGP